MRLKLSRWALPAAAVCAGWAGGQLAPLSSIAFARAAPAFTPLETLLAEDEIRQKIMLYGLYADGDGPGGRPRDLRRLADTLMTPDVISEIHLANGDPPFSFTGREIVAKTPPENDPDRARRIGGRHYLLNTVFDEVTPTNVETRTTAVYFDATKNLVGRGCKETTPGACGGVPVKTVMWIYQMSWRKTPGGWQIYKNILRDDN